MAELIPVDYRIRIETRRRLKAWSVVMGGALLICGPAIMYAFAQQHRSAQTLARLKSQFNASCVLIKRSDELGEKRQTLAARMVKIQTLMDDHILLAVLKRVSTGFSQKDCLQSVHIDTRAPVGGEVTTDSHDGAYFKLDISGVTGSPATLAELMTRLNVNGTPAVHPTLEGSHRQPFLDGNVTFFQMSAQQTDGNNG